MTRRARGSVGPELVALASAMGTITNACVQALWGVGANEAGAALANCVRQGYLVKVRTQRPAQFAVSPTHALPEGSDNLELRKQREMLARRIRAHVQAMHEDWTRRRSAPRGPRSKPTPAAKPAAVPTPAPSQPVAQPAAAGCAVLQHGATSPRGPWIRPDGLAARYARL